MDKISKIKTDLLMREWAEMVRECRASGLTVKEWCIDNDVNKGYGTLSVIINLRILTMFVNQLIMT